MEHLNQQHQQHLSSYSWDQPESSSLSDSSTRRSCSDEEVILASDRPKRSAGRKKFRETRHPVYRGVRRRNNDKWVCEVREPNKKTRIWLGTYQTAEMAARAHDVAALTFKGRSACLNFADSMWRLPVPETTDAKDIRKAATEAAEMFRHSNSSSDHVSRQESVTATATPTSKTKENVFYMDDEETEFGMPGLLASMAEGLLLSPPPSVASEYNYWEDVDNDAQVEVSLWSFSI